MDAYLPKDSSLIAKNRLQEFFQKDVGSLKTNLEALSREIAPQEEPLNSSHLERIAELLLKSCDDCRRVEEDLAGHIDAIAPVQEAFRKETEPWFSQSWIANRAQTKPTGFPGDCMMLATIYDELVPTRGLGGYLDACLLTLPLGIAVKERMKTAQAFLTQEVSWREGDVRILDIASGPCREFLNWTDQPEESRVLLTCLDTDQEALAYVSQNVVPTATGIEKIRLERYNALRTKSATATERNFGRFDILYSVGLADYIPDEPLISMLEGWRESVDEGGIVYVAFKDARRYDKTPYQWHLDWHFLQRTEEDCRQLLSAAGFDAATIEMERDASDIIIHFFCPIGTPAYTRVDAAEPAVRAPRLRTRGAGTGSR